MKRPAKGGKERPAKKPRTLQPIGHVVREDQHVFISLQGSSERVGELFEGGHSVVFIRSSVATSKTTLAEHLARQFPDKCVMVPFTGAGEDSVWERRTVGDESEDHRRLGRGFGAGGKTKPDLGLRRGSHACFLTKAMHSTFEEQHRLRTKGLAFFSRREASSNQQIVATPAESTQKFMWTPPLSHTSELQEQMKQAGVMLDQKSIQFFIQFCGAHRGTFIAAMYWVKSKQTSGESWDFKKTVGSVRNSNSNGGWACSDAEILSTLKGSHAVKVKGRYSCVRALVCRATPIRQDIRRELIVRALSKMVGS
ncbi:unnamed protein product [Symbiodinium sp. CCMP2592]|nr:unnamed protein product [Symbiodinium sp. CCMP2592]